MGFAAENQILVSRSFYEVVVRLSDDYETLQLKGVKQDKHVREHVVYQLSPQASKPPVRDGDSHDATNVEMASAAEPVENTGFCSRGQISGIFDRRLSVIRRWNSDGGTTGVARSGDINRANNRDV